MIDPPRSLPPQGPPSRAARAVAGAGLLVALPLAVAAEAWRAHREKVALGLIGVGLAVFTGFWRAASWVAGGEAA